jgi:GTP-binding protein EngB required for normal cell division
MFRDPSDARYRTLVDLPGWIHSESKTQSKKDIAIVQSLIREYIANDRTILLAVVSAKNDYANQVVIQECRNIDKDGSRTLGIITKADTLKTLAAIRT